MKSLINFPDILSNMSEKIDITIKLGDAFIEQQADVLNTIQKLRAKAQAAGNLKSNEQLKVVVEPAPAPDPQTIVVQQVPAPTQVIQIQSTSPEVIYVPTYNPTVVYGAWPYPAYPPYPCYPPYPPGYVASSALWFGAGVACGLAWGYAWGNCNWGHSNVNVNINQNVNFNRNINRNNYQNNFNRNGNWNGGQGNWQHNPTHRQGVPYRDSRTAQQFGGANQSARATEARDAYRGRADAGRQEINRGDISGGRNGVAPTQRPAGGAQDRVGAGQNRPNTAAGAQNRPSGSGVGSGAGQNRPSTMPSQNRSSGVGQNRSGSSGSSGGAFNGAGGSGSSARTASQRGQSSRGSAGGGASRGGGGASRGGGGRR